MFTLSYEVHESFILKGYHAKVCIRCNCIRPFCVNQLFHTTLIRLLFIPIIISKDYTNTIMINCDFCGFKLAQKPRLIDNKWSHAMGIDSLVKSTFSKYDNSKPSTDNLNSVKESMYDIKRKMVTQYLGIRNNIVLFLMCFILLLIIETGLGGKPLLNDIYSLLILMGLNLIISYVITLKYGNYAMGKHLTKYLETRKQHLIKYYDINVVILNEIISDIQDNKRD